MSRPQHPSRAADCTVTKGLYLQSFRPAYPFHRSSRVANRVWLIHTHEDTLVLFKKFSIYAALRGIIKMLAQTLFAVVSRAKRGNGQERSRFIGRCINPIACQPEGVSSAL